MYMTYMLSEFQMDHGTCVNKSVDVKLNMRLACSAHALTFSVPEYIKRVWTALLIILSSVPIPTAIN